MSRNYAMRGGLDPALKKILIIRSDRLGDFLVITPVIRAVCAYFKNARIDFLASDINAEAARGNPRLGTVHVMPHRRALAWPGLIRRLRRERYDLALCLNGDSSKAAFFTWCAGAAASCACATQARFAKYFDEHFIMPTYAHVTRTQLAFLEKLGIPPRGEAMEFAVPEEVKRKVDAEHPRVEGRRRLAVFIGNAKKTHSRWPGEKFAELADTLLSAHADLEIYLVHGRAEAPLLARFKGRDRLLSFSSGLLETAAFFTSCEALLTSSSGPWHIAAAVGTPTLGIVCRYNHDNWRPLEGRHYFTLPDNDDKDVRPVTVKAVRAMVEDFFSNDFPST